VKADEKKKSNCAPLSRKPKNMKTDDNRSKIPYKYQKQTRESTRHSSVAG
jgi:hypothetical protein